MKRIRMEVCPQQGDLKWKLVIAGEFKISHATQAEAIISARASAHLAEKMGNTVTLKIKRPDGTIREERTYPRSSDPRRTKG